MILCPMRCERSCRRRSSLHSQSRRAHPGAGSISGFVLLCYYRPLGVVLWTSYQTWYSMHSSERWFNLGARVTAHRMQRKLWLTISFMSYRFRPVDINNTLGTIGLCFCVESPTTKLSVFWRSLNSWVFEISSFPRSGCVLSLLHAAGILRWCIALHSARGMTRITRGSVRIDVFIFYRSELIESIQPI